MITIYEQLKRAKTGDILYVTCTARNVTSAASRLERRVETMQVQAVPVRRTEGVWDIILRVKVLK